jgi:hypothetical protein
MWKFYAKPGHVVALQGQNIVGQMRRYLGRSHKLTEGGITHAAKAEAVDVDPSSSLGRKISRLFAIESDAPLWPADEATARALGVLFVSTELKDGEWQKKATSTEKKADK